MTDVPQTPDFILYSRSSCSLCEAIEEELSPYIQRFKLSVERRYIDNDDVLEEAYGSRVPVLLIEEPDGERVLCEYHLDVQALLAELDV